MKHLKETLLIAAKAGVNTMIFGRHGVGKTAVVENLGEEFFVKTIILSQTDPFLLGGLPWRREVHTGEFQTIFATPDWITEVREAADAGRTPIVFLDEFNRADRYAHAAALRLVNEKSISGHDLPENTVFFAAINPETDGDEDCSFLNDPTLDRWAHICVHVDSSAFFSWADESGINKNVTAFLRTNETALSDFSLEDYFEQQILSRVGATPRSWDAVARIQDVIDATANSDENTFTALVDGVGFRLFQGLVGREHALQYITFLKDNFLKPIPTKDLLKATKKVRKRIKDHVENNQTEIVIASLDIAFEEIPNLVESADELVSKYSGFLDILCNELPKDIAAAFWHRENASGGADDFWKRLIIALSGTQHLQKIANLQR